MTPLPSVILELLNGAAAILQLFFLAALLRYLWIESRARGLHFRDWILFRVPAHMAFAWAVLITDVGGFGRAAAVWAWRRFYDSSAPFTPTLMVLFLLSVVVFIVGTVFKIRALTDPVYGFRPWVLSLGAVTLFVVASLLTR